MNNYTTFQTGGSADFFISPRNKNELINILKFTKENSIPFFILAGGANILVSDRGIRGIVINIRKLNSIQFENRTCTAEAGSSISELSELAAEKGLGGLDFIYGMPGSVGGAVWMNARCYDVSISDILTDVTYLDNSLEIKTLSSEIIQNSFSYKKSPFQNSDSVILSASFKLIDEDITAIRKRMNKNREDRKRKGHYRFPSAGSVFKNNRAFGKPSGVLIDSLGLKGFTIGGAQVAFFHGNIVVNTGDAKSSDIMSVVRYVREAVFENFGFLLEPEIQFVGDWEAGELS